MPISTTRSYSDFAGENLDYWKDYVRHELKEWGHWVTNAIGLKGYRIDQAKELHPEYLREWLGHGAMYDKFSVSEYFDGNVDKLEDYAKRSGSKVFDFALFFTLREMANDRAGFFDMRKLVSAGLLARNSNLAVTFGLTLGASGWSPEETAAAFLYHTAIGFVSAAMRLNPIGQQEGQRILGEWLPLIDRISREVDRDERMSSWSPIQDIYSMRHGSLEWRLFRS